MEKVLDVYGTRLASVNVEMWLCVQERGKSVDGDRNGQPHLHMAIHTDTPYRWAGLKKDLARAGVTVNFSGHSFYATAVRYLTPHELDYALQS